MTDPQFDGVTLAQRLAKGPLEPVKAESALEQLLSQLAVAHEAGTIHGNISPRNIILSPDGKATLIGFPGTITAAEPMARFGKGALDPGFVAPEQVLDEPISKRTDIYSLGVVAYAMLTGKDLFGASEGVTADNVFYRILYKPSPRVPEEFLVGLGASVGPAIDRAMSKEPQSRQADARAFLSTLGADATVLTAAAVAPALKLREKEREEREKELKKESKRKAGWMPFAIAGAVIVLLLAIGLGTAYGMGAIGGGGTDTTVVVVETTTSSTEAVATTAVTEPSTTTTATTEAVTTTATSELTTTTLELTTTTLPASSTTTTVKATTTTRAPTTTTALKKVTITITDANKTYNGSAQAPSYTVSPSASVSVTYTGGHTNAGSYPFTIKVTQAGYSGSASGTLVIGKADATISVGGWSGAYDGNSHGAHLNSAVGVGGQNLSGSVDLGASFSSVGTHYATWTFSHQNYNSESRSVLIEITE